MGSSLLVEGTLFSQREDEAKPWGLPPYHAGLACQREEAAGSCGVGYITSTSGPLRAVPLEPCFQHGGQQWAGGGGGWHSPAC